MKQRYFLLEAIEKIDYCAGGMVVAEGGEAHADLSKGNHLVAEEVKPLA